MLVKEGTVLEASPRLETLDKKQGDADIHLYTNVWRQLE